MQLEQSGVGEFLRVRILGAIRLLPFVSDVSDDPIVWAVEPWELLSKCGNTRFSSCPCCSRDMSAGIGRQSNDVGIDSLGECEQSGSDEQHELHDGV